MAPFDDDYAGDDRDHNGRRPGIDSDFDPFGLGSRVAFNVYADPGNPAAVVGAVVAITGPEDRRVRDDSGGEWDQPVLGLSVATAGGAV